MKKLYEELELEVIRFDVEDIVTASSCTSTSPYAGTSYTGDDDVMADDK